VKDRYLLDTHAAIWFFNGDRDLSETAKGIILNTDNTICISIASAWELVIKTSLGKLDFTGGAAGFIRLAKDNGFDVCPVETDHLTALESLPWFHRDPFDRLLIATARSSDMCLITTDRNIARYEVVHIW
jgi:PIN domain nuclease of toxin-antitoxin system